MELIKYKKNQRLDWIKQSAYLSTLLVVSVGVLYWYQGQAKTLTDELLLIEQKSRLITRLHQEMLAVSNVQYRLLHASNYGEAHDLLVLMSDNVSNYVVDLRKFERMAEGDDIELINRFRNNFKQWRHMTDDISSYAYLVSSTDLINILSAMQLNLLRLGDEIPVLLVAKQEQIEGLKF